MTTTRPPITRPPVRTDTAEVSALRAVLVAGERPPRPGAATVSIAFGHRALLKIKHVPEQLFDVTVLPVMTTLMFTYLFGGAVAGSVDTYAQYLVPGVLVQSIVMITMYTGVALNIDITKGVFDRFRSLPIWRPSALVGALLGDAARFAVASTIIVVLGLVIGFRPAGGPVGVLAGVALLLVFAFSLGWVWTLLGLVMRSANSVTGTSMVVLFPLTFVSNIFIDPATLPGWLQAFVGINPITHLVTAVRGLMQATATTGDVVLVLGWSAALVAVFGPLTMHRYSRRT